MLPLVALFLYSFSALCSSCCICFPSLVNDALIEVCAPWYCVFRVHLLTLTSWKHKRGVVFKLVLFVASMFRKELWDVVIAFFLLSADLSDDLWLEGSCPLCCGLPSMLPSLDRSNPDLIWFWNSDNGCSPPVYFRHLFSENIDRHHRCYDACCSDEIVRYPLMLRSFLMLRIVRLVCRLMIVS